MAGIDNNTVLYLRGDSFNDLSPNPKNVTNNGCIVDTGDDLNKVIFFNGTTNYLCVDKNTINDIIENDFTIELYFKTNSSDTQTIFMMDDSTNPNSTTCSIRLVINDNNSVVLSFNAGYESSYPKIVYSYTIPINTFYHIAITKLGKNVSLFLNGVFVGSTNIQNPIKKENAPLTFGRYGNANNRIFSGIITSIRISNVARYTEDFTPPTQPFNSLAINVSNQTDTNIEFNLEKLGQETINKVEVLVNGIVSETYTDSYDNIDYLIDKSLLYFGNNNITIRVTFDDKYTEEKVLAYKSDIPTLPVISGTSSLLNTLNSIKEATSLVEAERNKLAHILTSKNVEVSEDEKMSELIDKVELFDSVPERLYLYKDGDECVDVTGGFIIYKNNANTVPVGVFESKDSYIELDATKGYASCGSNNTINVSEFKTLYIDSETNDSNAICCFTTVQNLVTTNRVAVVETTKNGVRGVVSIDISKLNSSYFLGLGLGTSITKIYKIWLEK